MKSETIKSSPNFEIAMIIWGFSKDSLQIYVNVSPEATILTFFKIKQFNFLCVVKESTSLNLQPWKKDTISIKEVLLKWGHFERAKLSLKHCLSRWYGMLSKRSFPKRYCESLLVKGLQSNSLSNLEDDRII